jgi:protein tyrosine phosphatase
MLIVRSPTITFAFIFSIFSICLTIVTSNIKHEESANLIQCLIICPPLNCIFLFLSSVTWIERRFRLSYIPLICLFILMFTSIALTVISTLFLSLSIIMYFNLIYYCFFSIFFIFVLITIIVSYSYGSLCIHRYRNMMTTEQQNNEIPKDVKLLRVDKHIIKSPNDDELILFMSQLPGRRIRHDIRNIQDDLNQIQAHTIITLNESKELSFMNMTNKNIYNMDTYSTHIKRANIEHIMYPIRDRFIPKSISDYIQFIYSIILNANHFNRTQILVHCMGGMGRTGMTVVCLELVYEYVMKNNNDKDKKQRFMERFCHYPFLLTNTCRVCQAISNVRKTRPGTIHNPLQIMFAHEFYARLMSNSYMKQIKNILNLNEKLLSTNDEEFQSPTYTSN